MEFLYIVCLLVIIVLILTARNAVSSRIDKLEFRIMELQSLLRQTQGSRSPAEVVKPPEVVPPKPELVKPPEPKPIVVLPPPPVIENKPEPVAEVNPFAPRPVTPPQPKTSWKPEPQPSFFEKHPDLEKFIGENLVNKIGIAILVLAIGFFVKYAIDNNWVGPVGRVGIGVLCGGILIGIAHRLRNSYTAFSSVLVGGGLAVLYFTITLAYHQFHLFGQTVAFIILIGITVFAVVLSMLYDKQELAVIALIGGLSSPFMVSSGNANYSALFIYLIILNAGLLVIAYQKAWRILNISAFALTVIIVAGVIYTIPNGSYHIGFTYISVLYLLFFGINVANNVKDNKKFIAADFTILLINTALYFAAGLYLLTVMHHENMRGLFSASLALINLVLSYVLFRNKKVDSNILYLLIGITLTFLSLTAPIQLHGHNITLFWAAETVLLYWLYLKSDIKIMRLTSLLIWGIMLCSLMLDWLQVYGYAAKPLPILANKGFITTLSAAISSFLLHRLIHQREGEPLYGFKIPGELHKVFAFLLLFLSGLLEINLQFSTRYPSTSLNILYLMLYVPMFIYLFSLLSKKISAIRLDWTILASLAILGIGTYLAFNQEYFDAQVAVLLDHKISGSHFIAHWIGAVFVGLLFYQFALIIKDNMRDNAAVKWLTALGMVAFLSFEVSLITNHIFYKPGRSIDSIETVYIQVGLPILWGAFSFALMWLGMLVKDRTLRIISLTLFTGTLVKLFVFDIRNIPPAGKIAAFFCLGVLLLVISFMYQKVKKIIVEDEAPKQDQ